jgi:hypothetical protein
VVTPNAKLKSKLFQNKKLTQTMSARHNTLKFNLDFKSLKKTPKDQHAVEETERFSYRKKFGGIEGVSVSKLPSSFKKGQTSTTRKINKKFSHTVVDTEPYDDEGGQDGLKT